MRRLSALSGKSRRSLGRVSDLCRQGYQCQGLVFGLRKEDLTVFIDRLPLSVPCCASRLRDRVEPLESTCIRLLAQLCPPRTTATHSGRSILTHISVLNSESRERLGRNLNVTATVRYWPEADILEESPLTWRHSRNAHEVIAPKIFGFYGERCRRKSSHAHSA